MDELEVRREETLRNTMKHHETIRNISKHRARFEATSFVRSLAESGSLQEEETNTSFLQFIDVGLCGCVCLGVYIICFMYLYVLQTIET